MISPVLTTHNRQGPAIKPQSSVNGARLEAAWRTARAHLARERTSSGHWVGQLSTSALSTATAISALALVRKANTKIYAERQTEIDTAIEVACGWLLDQQNPDGGFGDTSLSHSNIATTLLVLAAWQIAGYGQHAYRQIELGWGYCERVGKWDALRRRYGKDKTFVAPILTNCALAGIVPWDDVPTLPFEAAWLPQRWYRLARMPVVSYAVPALVAIGQAKHYHRPLRGPWGALRTSAIDPTLAVLDRMQPSSGGYLEAVPLTSFVLMCLADMKLGDHPVAVRAVDFLLQSRLADGSLPIDTNLATWTTSLSIWSLGYGPEQNDNYENIVTPTTIRWLLSCQHWSDHPFTGASPGGWGWSNLSGAVPDADDTPAALLALSKWMTNPQHRTPILMKQIEHSGRQGLEWLMKLQNRDGGWPTFCRGWGKLPFDRSGSDLTAHALRAMGAWQRLADAGILNLPDHLLRRMPGASEAGFEFLRKKQNPDGSWFPLWFGNQDRTDEENPVYGTSKVLMAYADWQRDDEEVARRGWQWLVAHQNVDGGWGGGPSVPYRAGDGANHLPGSSVEESGLALEALLAGGATQSGLKPTIMRGLDWLVAAVEAGHLATSWPIGFYFAKLWYHERLYPVVAATAALGAAIEQFSYAPAASNQQPENV